MFFWRVFALATVIASLAISSHARMHHVRTVAVPTGGTAIDPATFIANMNVFQKDITSCSDDISKAASSGEDPEDEMKKLNNVFTSHPFPASVKLSADQEKECTAIVSAVLTKSIKACHDVAANHKYMKYYAKWTETDFAMHSFMQKLAGVSFVTYRQSLISAGKTSAVYLQDMKMRHMVNDFRGMGVSYD